MQWNSFGIPETPEDGRLHLKHVMKGGSGTNSSIVDGIILCMKGILMQQDA
jgi:hypothetical protein